MKRNLFKVCCFSMVLLSFCFVFGCSKSEGVLDIDANEEKNYRETVLRLGFDTVGIRIDGDRIFVEEDIVLYKSKISDAVSRQATVYQGAFLTNQPIRYWISPSISGHDAIKGAIDQYSFLENPASGPIIGSPWFWNQYLQIVFIEVNSDCLADLVFYSFNQISGLYAYAEWPTRIPPENFVELPKLQIGRNININLYNWNQLNYSERVFLVAHEMGHSFGIRHTDWRGRELEHTVDGSIQIGAYTVPGTSNTGDNPDPNSVFNSGANNASLTWNGFTSGDVLAIFHVAGGGAY